MATLDYDPSGASGRATLRFRTVSLELPMRDRNEELNQPPGPRGHGTETENLRRLGTDYHRFVRELVARYGDVVHFRAGSQPICLVNDPSLIKEVLLVDSASYTKPETVKDSNRGYWGDGLTTLEGENWRERRRLLQPLFHATDIASFAPVIVAVTQDLVVDWDGRRGRELSDSILALVSQVAAAVTLGARLPSNELSGVQFSVPMLFARSGTIYLDRPRAARRMPHTLAQVDALIEERDACASLFSKIVHAMQRAGIPIDRDVLVAEAMQLLFAGHVTMSRSIEAVLAALVDHPSVAATFLAEVEEHLGSRSPDWDTVRKLTYCQLVIKEALRLCVAGDLVIHREVARPTRLGSYLLHPGTMLWIDCHLLHTDRRYFEDPERFWPERFDRDHSAGVPKFAYLPFGAGPRSCVGNGLAMMEIQLIVTTIVQRYRLSRELGTDGERILCINARS